LPAKHGLPAQHAAAATSAEHVQIGELKRYGKSFDVMQCFHTAVTAEWLATIVLAMQSVQRTLQLCTTCESALITMAVLY
jgi:hypothetical protein